MMKAHIMKVFMFCLCEETFVLYIIFVFHFVFLFEGDAWDKLSAVSSYAQHHCDMPLLLIACHLHLHFSGSYFGNCARPWHVKILCHLIDIADLAELVAVSPVELHHIPLKSDKLLFKIGWHFIVNPFILTICYTQRRLARNTVRGTCILVVVSITFVWIASAVIEKALHRSLQTNSQTS